MKLPTRSATLAIAAALLAGACQAEDDARLAESRALVSAFAGSLQSELQQALTQGGPTVAVSVCKDSAPQIASELSRLSGAKVGRTSLRYRNPANAPEPWERQVLLQFDAQAALPESPRPLESFTVEDDGTARYLSAIETAAVCLVCHGAALASELDAQLAVDYPHDRAINYAIGDVRGAFSITWPADAEVARR